MAPVEEKLYWILLESRRRLLSCPRAVSEKEMSVSGVNLREKSEDTPR